VRHPKKITRSLVLAGLVLVAACAGKVKTTSFLNPKFDFSFVERVAVLSFDNLSNDHQAGFRSTRLMITELLASGAVDVVEPGEVRAAVSKLPGAQTAPGAAFLPNQEEFVALGKELGVQAVIVGTVAQAETLRSGAVNIPVITLDVHMVETETGATVWAATHTEKGASAGARALGTGGHALSATTRRCVKRLVEELVK